MDRPDHWRDCRADVRRIAPAGVESDMSDEDGFEETETGYEAFVFVGALLAMGIVAVVLGVWAWLELWR